MVMGKSPWLLPEENAPEERSETYEAQHLMVARDKNLSSIGRFGAWPNLVSGGMVTLRICLTAKNLCRQQNGRRACCGERMWAVELQLCFFACG